jgi:hypothetical protein
MRAQAWNASLTASFLRGCSPGFLHRDRAGHRIDHRAELCDRSVAHQLDNAPVMLSEQRVEHLATQSLEDRQGAGLVLLDEMGIADDVGGKDRRKPSLNPCCRHGRVSLGGSAGRAAALVLSYRTLDVEQIGSVYETIMGFTVQTAPGRVLAIRAGRQNRTPVFADVERLAALKLSERAKYLKDVCKREGTLPKAVATALGQADDADGVAAARSASFAVNLKLGSLQ